MNQAATKRDSKYMLMLVHGCRLQKKTAICFHISLKRQRHLSSYDVHSKCSGSAEEAGYGELL